MIGVGAQLRLARLWLVTDTRSASGDLADFLDAVLTGGVEVVQIKEPGLDHGTELAALRQAWDVASRHRHLVAVSDSAELAADFGADVVHVAGRQQHRGLTELKSGLGRFTRLGVDAGDPDALQQMLDEPAADFVLVGAQRDLDLAARAAELAPVAAMASKPWLAAGEFDLARLEQAIEVGVRRIAVARTLTEAADPHRAAAELAQRLRSVWADDPELTRLTFAALADQS